MDRNGSIPAIVRKRYAELLWRGCVTQNMIRQPKIDCRVIESRMREEDDGTVSFTDVDYASDCKSLWGAEYHYGHIIQMILGFGRERLENDETYRSKLIGALRYWCVHDFSNPNWWHNDIGTPENLSDICTLLYDWLPADLLASAAAIIDRGSLRGNPQVTKRTGANLIWGCSVSLRLAGLLNDEELLAMASSRAAEELVYGAEGIQTDGGFFQHGPRLYSGGYGRSFAYNVAMMIYVLQNTPYQFPRERLSIYAVHMLDGLRMMSARDALDWQCVGREYTRPGAERFGILRYAVEILADAEDMVRRDEFIAWREEMDGAPRPDATRYYPVVGFLAHHTGGLYIGTKLICGQLLGEEICNGEGGLGYNVSYGGVTCAMVNGREYDDAAPYWRYDRIPGTTARRESDAELLAHPTAWTKRCLPDDYAGGAEKDGYAAVWQRQDHETIRALTASFAFPGGFVRLVTGIRDDDSAPLYTTVEQSFLQGAVEREGNSIIHAGIRYTPLAGTTFTPEITETEGRWCRNSVSERQEWLDKVPMFGLSVGHSPGETSACAYMLSPANAPEPVVEVLRNDEEVQSIRLPDGRVMAVDHRTHEIALDARK